MRTRPVDLLVYGSGECRRWLLYLASPALLGDLLPEKALAKLLLLPDTARGIAESLLRPLGLPGVKPVRPYLASTTPIEVYMPGWSMAIGNYRRPMLVIPPATMVFVEADENRVRQVVERGLGEYAHLG